MVDYHDEFGNTPPIQNESVASFGEAVNKEFYNDFFSPQNIHDGTSLIRRPDAISLNYLTSFTLGPVDLRDPSEGILYRPWRLRIDFPKIYVCRANDANDDWEAETLLYTISDGIGIREADIAFTQNADPVVCMEREDGFIWIYFYNSAPGHELFEMLQFYAGRSPRAVLDDPFDVTNSDVQVFYIDLAEDALVYLQQRERYVDKHITVKVNVTDLYVEDVFRDNSLRLHVVLSRHNIAQGRWYLELYSSTLFPLVLPGEGFITSHEAQGGELRDLFIYGFTLPEELETSHDLLSGSLVDLVLEYFVSGEANFASELVFASAHTIIITGYLNIEGIDPTHSISSGELRLAWINGYLNIEGIDPTHSLTASSVLRDVLVGYLNIEGIDPTHSIVSGTLA